MRFKKSKVQPEQGLRILEYSINVLLIIVTFILGFVCQEWVADRATNAYSNLAYSNSVMSVSNNLNRIQRIISSVEFGNDHLYLVTQYEDYDANDYDQNRISAGFLDVFNAACDSIHMILPEIVNVERIVKLPLMNIEGGESLCEEMDRNIFILQQWDIEDKMRKEKIDSDEEYMLMALTKYGANIPYSDYWPMCRRHFNFSSDDEFTLYLSSTSKMTMTLGDIHWLKYTSEVCVPALLSLSSIFNDFSSLKLVKQNKTLLQRIKQYPVATLAICILFLFILFLLCYILVLTRSEEIKMDDKQLSR